MVELYQEIRSLAKMQREYITGINRIVGEFNPEKTAIYFEGMSTQKMTIVIRSSEMEILDAAASKIVEFSRGYFLGDCKIYANKHQFSRYVTIREIDYYYTAYVRANQKELTEEGGTNLETI